MEMVDEQVITIITSGDTNGRKLSIKLEKNSIPHEVLIVSHTLPKRIRGNIFRYFKSYFGRLSFFRKIRYLGLPAYGVKESYVGLNNGRRLLRELNKKKRRFLILMGGGIISEEVISTAKEGVINVHPGKIPEIRGLDAIFHSILKEIPLTLTAHFVDKGIDTGEIIRSILIPCSVNDSIEDILIRSDYLSVDLMYQICDEIHSCDKPQIKEKDKDKDKDKKKYPLCKKLSKDDYKIFLEKFSTMKHVQLYEKLKKA